MSEAPERKYANWPERLWANDDGFTDRDWMADADSPEYIRADLARLPEDLAERIREQRVAFKADAVDDAVWRHQLLGDILAWNEQQGGEKE